MADMRAKTLAAKKAAKEAAIANGDNNDPAVEIMTVNTDDINNNAGHDVNGVKSAVNGGNGPVPM